MTCIEMTKEVLKKRRVNTDRLGLESNQIKITKQRILDPDLLGHDSRLIHS